MYMECNMKQFAYSECPIAKAHCIPVQTVSFQ